MNSLISWAWFSAYLVGVFLYIFLLVKYLGVRIQAQKSNVIWLTSAGPAHVQTLYGQLTLCGLLNVLLLCLCPLVDLLV